MSLGDFNLSFDNNVENEDYGDGSGGPKVESTTDSITTWKIN